MGLSFIGSYSGIDQSTIDQLMEAERVPLKQLERKQTSIKGKMDAWKDINTRLNSLFKKVEALKDASTFNTKVAKSSDDSYVSMIPGTNAADGKYNINVEKLATNSSIVGNRVDNVIDDKGKQLALGKSGYFSITNSDIGENRGSSIIEVEAHDTLKDIVNKINAKTKDSKDGDKTVKGTGISATIVDNRIVLTDENTGDRTISLKNVDAEGNAHDGTILEDIGLIEMSGVTYPLGESEAKFNGVTFTKGQQAEFTINGIKIERDTNTIYDAIEGVTINLNKVHAPGELDTITVSSDTEKAAQAMQDFVDQYNSTMQFIEEKTKAGDPKVPGSKGVLAGESSLVRLQTSLRQSVTGSFKVSGSDITDISQIGISTTDRYGALSFDKEKFLEELVKDKDSVMNFLDPKVEGEVGFVARANDYIDSFISTKDGLIKSQNASFEKSLKDLDTRIENFEERMVKKEAYYIRKFTALDIAMMKAESQMSWLAGQINAMNGGK